MIVFLPMVWVYRFWRVGCVLGILLQVTLGWTGRYLW